MKKSRNRAKLKQRREMQRNFEIWLQRNLEEISTGIYPRTWIEEEALNTAKEIILNDGLGNPGRKYHKRMARVRDVVTRADNGNLYGREGGMEAAIKAGVQFSKNVDGVELADEQVLVSETGSCPMLGWVAEGMSELDKSNSQFLDDQGILHVVVWAWAYGRHLSVLPKRGIQIHLVNFEEQLETGVPFDKVLETAITTYRAKLVVMSSVFNPSLRILTFDQKTLAVEVTKKHGVVLFMDDAYRHLYRKRQGPIPSVLSVKGAQDALVCATISSSKAWQSPCKGGELFGHPEIIRRAARIRNHKGEGGDIPTQLAWAAMLLDYDYLEETRAFYDKLANFYVQIFNACGWTELQESGASIFLRGALPKILVDRGWSADDFVRALAQRGVIFYPSSFFPGAEGEKWVRITMRGEKRAIIRAGEVIGDIIAKPPFEILV